MEDELTIQLNFKDSDSTHFFAVYDGHGSNDVSKFAAAHLHNVIAEHPAFRKCQFGTYPGIKLLFCVERTQQVVRNANWLCSLCLTYFGWILYLPKHMHEREFTSCLPRVSCLDERKV